MIWRSVGLRTDFVNRVQVKVDGRRHNLQELLTYHRELADELHARDRVHTYGSFYIADLGTTFRAGDMAAMDGIPAE